MPRAGGDDVEDRDETDEMDGSRKQGVKGVEGIRRSEESEEDTRCARLSVRRGMRGMRAAHVCKGVCASAGRGKHPLCVRSPRFVSAARLCVSDLSGNEDVRPLLG